MRSGLRIWTILLIFGMCSLDLKAAELRFCLHSDPKTFDPLLVQDDSSATISYLTGGVLLRVNRNTQVLEPELATDWKISKDARTITFTLREHIYFSDGTSFGVEDVAATVIRLMDPALHSPIGDSFRSGTGQPITKILGKNRLSITFPAAVTGLDRLFDQVPIQSMHSPRKERAVLGPYYVADHKFGAYVLLKRNPNYWKHDTAGRQLPYIDTIRLDVQPNRDIEVLRFQRGEIQLINSIDAEYYDRLASSMPAAVHDSGPSFDTEQLWFNQVGRAPLPAYKLAWFRSAMFRQAISKAINREDMTRVVFGSHASPASGVVSKANKIWFNSKLHPIRHDTNESLRLLSEDGFRLQKSTLYDRGNHPVEFSIITNSGNKYRERMALMIQQDLSHIGIKVNVVTLDFPSLIDRIAEKFNYEAAILGFQNVEADPATEMNVWLSSGDNHQWNPRQQSPETPWEAEIDRLMRLQASAAGFKQRKAAWDRVQEIVADQLPFIYLVNKDALSAVSPSLHGAQPVALSPQTYWNIEQLSFENTVPGEKR